MHEHLKLEISQLEAALVLLRQAQALLEGRPTDTLPLSQPSVIAITPPSSTVSTPDTVPLVTACSAPGVLFDSAPDAQGQ